TSQVERQAGVDCATGGRGTAQSPRRDAAALAIRNLDNANPTGWEAISNGDAKDGLPPSRPSKLGDPDEVVQRPDRYRNRRRRSGSRRRQMCDRAKVEVAAEVRARDSTSGRR